MTAGLRGWQWLFIVEGLPSIALGFCIRFWLPDCPNAATFLSSDEQALIQQQVAGTQASVATFNLLCFPLYPISWRIQRSNIPVLTMLRCTDGAQG